jgi:hypothetical protein
MFFDKFGIYLKLLEGKFVNAETVTAMLQRDRREWDLLTKILDAHPEGNLHDLLSPPFSSRDVYAHLGRWIDHSNGHMGMYLREGKMSDEMANPYDINFRWQLEDTKLTLGEARKLAQDAFARRIELIKSVPLDRWDKTLEKIASYDGSKHLSAHRGYVRAK